MRRAGLLLGCLLLAGCAGQVIDSFNARHITSCIWWESRPLSGARGVTATGGADLATCLAVPCQGR